MDQIHKQERACVFAFDFVRNQFANKLPIFWKEISKINERTV